MRVFVTFAFLIQYVVAGWEIFSITRDPLSLGLIGLAEAIPAIGIALYAGHRADIGNKRNILGLSLFALLFSSSCLTLFTSSYMRSINSDALTVNIMYACIFTTGLARGFYGPTQTAFISQLVPRDRLVKAATLNSTFWQMSAIVGPALGGFLYGWFGMTISMCVVLLCLVTGIFIVYTIPPKPIIQHNNTEAVSKRLREGIKYVFENKVILSALSLDMFSVLFGGAVALLPVFADSILHCGAQGLGVLRAAPSVGAVIIMSTFSVVKMPGRMGMNLLIAVAGFGITIILFGLSTNFFLSVFLLCLNGAFDSISVIIRANIIQLLVPDHMRGRVSAVNTMFIGSSNEIGAFESGVTAKLFGTVPAVVIGGTVTMCIVGFTALKGKAIKAFHYEQEEEKQEDLLDQVE